MPGLPPEQQWVGWAFDLAGTFEGAPVLATGGVQQVQLSHPRPAEEDWLPDPLLLRGTLTMVGPPLNAPGQETHFAAVSGTFGSNAITVDARDASRTVRINISVLSASGVPLALTHGQHMAVGDAHVIDQTATEVTLNMEGSATAIYDVANPWFA